MTPEQLARRGRSISASKARKSKDPVLLAIIASEWKTADNYAERRLRVSGASLSGYRSGKVAAPEHIVALCEKDLGIPRSYWKAIVD